MPLTSPVVVNGRSDAPPCRSALLINGQGVLDDWMILPISDPNVAHQSALRSFATTDPPSAPILRNFAALIYARQAAAQARA